MCLAYWWKLISLLGNNICFPAINRGWFLVTYYNCIKPIIKCTFSDYQNKSLMMHMFIVLCSLYFVIDAILQQIFFFRFGPFWVFFPISKSERDTQDLFIFWHLYGDTVYDSFIFRCLYWKHLIFLSILISETPYDLFFPILISETTYNLFANTYIKDTLDCFLQHLYQGQLMISFFNTYISKRNYDLLFITCIAKHNLVKVI